MNGTWKTTGGGPDLPVMPVAAAVLAVALAVWLATILLIVAVVLTVLAGLIVFGAVMMRRRYPDYSERVDREAKALKADMAAPKVVEHHHYVHPLGATAEGTDWAPLIRGAVIKEEN